MSIQWYYELSTQSHMFTQSCLLVKCYFCDCQSTSAGGCVSISNLAFSSNSTTAQSCSAPNSGSYHLTGSSYLLSQNCFVNSSITQSGNAGLAASVNGRAVILENTCDSCFSTPVSTNNVMSLHGMITIHSYNATHTMDVRSGAGLRIGSSSSNSCVSKFLICAGNVGWNIIFGRQSGASSNTFIRANVVNNSQSQALVVSATGTVAIKESVFARNSNHVAFFRVQEEGVNLIVEDCTVDKTESAVNVTVNTLYDPVPTLTDMDYPGKECNLLTYRFTKHRGIKNYLRNVLAIALYV